MCVHQKIWNAKSVWCKAGESSINATSGNVFVENVTTRKAASEL